MSKNQDTKSPWKGQRDAFIESLVYLDGRRRGQIKSLKTPWKKFNDAGTNGIEWHNTVVIGGRPASGKTLIKDQIIRESFILNPGEDFRVLEFQLEMLARTSAIREYSSVLGKSYKYLCSSEFEGQYLTDKELELCKLYAKERVKYPIDIVEEPCTVAEFEETVKSYMEFHSSVEYIEKVIEENGKPKTIKIDEKKYKKTIVTLDHSLLIKKGKGEKDKLEVLYLLGETVTALKRKYPIIFIILSQLNRNIDTPERNEEGKYGNYILESDLFGSDALLQHADILIGINRPAKQKIRYYGPDKFLIEDESIIVLHFLKCRNGDSRMSFFKAEFEKMKLSEIETPQKFDKKIKV